MEHRREDVLARLKSEVDRWSPHSATHSLVHPATAVAALGELTPGGALMKGYTDDSLARMYFIIIYITLIKVKDSLGS
jgi:hypothetical protein